MKKINFILFILFTINYTFCFEEIGMASWYGPNFHGKKTANGEIFDTNDYTAAHKSLPFGSIVKVISIENNKFTIVRINDRGPFKKNRILDLSKKAAEELGMIKTGTMKVKTILLEQGNNKYHRYSNQKFYIQIISFNDKSKALEFIEKIKEKFKEKNLNFEIINIKLDKEYFRIIINNLNYYDLQKYRVKLYKEGITDYIIKKKKKQ